MDKSISFTIRLLAVMFLAILALTAFFADWLSSENPIYVVYQGKAYYPLFATQAEFDSLPNIRTGKRAWQRVADADWKHIPYQTAYWTLAPFSTKSPGKTKLQKPFSEEKMPTQKAHFKHYFGTDSYDIDVLASIIQGTRTSLSVGIGSLLLITLLGLTLGGMAGYFGDTKWLLTRGQQYGLALGLFLGLFYGFYLPRYDMQNAFAQENIGKGLFLILIAIGILGVNLVVFAWLGKKMSFLPFFNKRKALPIDSLITQVTDIQMALPTILIVIALSLMLPKNILSLILIIGCAGYMGIARLARSLTSQIRNLPYIEAAEALGLSQLHILFRHILPNVLPTLVSILLLNMADLILLEASFSFLGIGLPLETVSWGKILNQARANPEAWWLTLFPALMIAATAGSFKILGKQK